MGSATGNHWTTVDGFHARTQADGSFSFTYPAPSMFNIRYRVKAGAYVSAARVFNAKTQDLTIRVTGQPVNNTNAPARVGVDRSVRDHRRHHPGQHLPQPRVAGSPRAQGPNAHPAGAHRREHVARPSTRPPSGTTAADTSPASTEGAGVAVYRVRAENYFTHGNQVGWTQSFPLYVLVGQAPRTGTPVATAPCRPRPCRWTRRPAAAPSRRPPASTTGGSPRCSTSPGSTDSRSRALRPEAPGSGAVGWTPRPAADGCPSTTVGWRWTASGTSERAPGDFGTTRATLHGNAMTHGRWETSVRIRNAYERGGRAYQVLVELIPANAVDYDCGGTTSPSRASPRSPLGRVRGPLPLYSWDGTTTAPYTPLVKAYNVAVEVARATSRGSSTVPPSGPSPTPRPSPAYR